MNRWIPCQTRSFRWIALASGTFALSLVFRTIVLLVSKARLIGMRHLSHLMNGAMVGFLLVALVQYTPALDR